MKALELRIFEKHPDADAYRVRGFFTPYALVARANRFTDAELAAEYQAAAREMDVDFFASHEQENPELMAKEDTLLRFATSPHFDGAS